MTVSRARRAPQIDASVDGGRGARHHVDAGRQGESRDPERGAQQSAAGSSTLAPIEILAELSQGCSHLRFAHHLS